MSAGRTLERLRFVPLTDAAPEVRERVRELRNQESVRRHSYTDHFISEEEHARWLASLRGNAHHLAMAVTLDGDVLGSVSLSNISRRNGTADWAFYLDDVHQGKGLGSVVEFRLIEMAFNELGLEKLSCEVLDTNPAVVRLHEKFGFVREGLRKGQALKDGARVDVHVLGLTKPEWEKRRDRMRPVVERAGR